MGTKMLYFAESYLRGEGMTGFRLDCVSHLPSLNAFYTRQGFEFVAEQDMGGRFVNLYQKVFQHEQQKRSGCGSLFVQDEDTLARKRPSYTSWSRRVGCVRTVGFGRMVS